jgi:hypothetical protein
MTPALESAQQSKMDPVTPSWKLTVTDRRLMWLQKQHSGACGHKLQLWASGAFKEPSHAQPIIRGYGLRKSLANQAHPVQFAKSK